MSRELGTISNTGSRGVDMTVVSYWGGEEKERCLQLTAPMQSGGYGYVQLTIAELRLVLAIAELADAEKFKPGDEWEVC